MKTNYFRTIIGAIILFACMLGAPSRLLAQTTDTTSTNNLMSGVVEGFYGTPWTSEQRYDIIEFMGEFDLTHYVYAPKDDPLHRSRWADLYGSEAIDAFRNLLTAGRDNNVTIWFAISPGLSISYSDTADFRRLTRKLDQVIEAGFRHIALFLDDVPEVLRTKADIEAYPNLAYAHADLIQRLYAYLAKSDVGLMVCPTVYAGTFGDQNYLSVLGPSIPATVPLFWTGPDIASPDIPLTDVENWTSRTSIKPLIWDNFPVNDFEVWRPFLGPYPHRDPDGLRSTLGVIANPGPSAYTNMIGLATLADLLRDPEAYEPAVTHELALKRLFGEEAYPHVSFVSDFYSAYGWEDHVFSPIYVPGLPLEMKIIEEALEQLVEHLAALDSIVADDDRRLKGFISEVRGYVTKTTVVYATMKANSDYKQEDGFLKFRSELDEYKAVNVDRVMSSNSRDWRRIKQIPMYRDGEIDKGARTEYTVRYAATSDTLYSLLRMITSEVIRMEEPTLFNGNLVTFVIADEANIDRTHLGKNDIFLSMKLPNSDHKELGRFVLDLGGFGQRGLADITLQQVSTFFHQFATVPPEPDQSRFLGIRSESRHSVSEFFIMVAVPRHGQSEFRLNWSLRLMNENYSTIVTTNRMASRRGYLGNPQTWVRVVISD